MIVVSDFDAPEIAEGCSHVLHDELADAVTQVSAFEFLSGHFFDAFEPLFGEGDSDEIRGAEFTRTANVFSHGQRTEKISAVDVLFCHGHNRDHFRREKDLSVFCNFFHTMQRNGSGLKT